MAPPAIAAVTFDFWNTLVAEYPGARALRVEALRSALADVGVRRSADAVEAAVDELRRWFDQRWLDNEVVDPRLGAEHVADSLGLRPDDAVHTALDAVFRAGSDPELLTVAPGIAETLTALRRAGVRIGIISDTGFAPGATLRRYLSHHGLLDAFDHWSFSDEVGVFKPDAKIFAHAAAGLRVGDPSRLAHVGDLRRTDVGGAVAAGWVGVRYRGLHDDASTEPDADIVVDHHDQLLDALGLS